MSHETSKGYNRRLFAGYFEHYLKGHGIDIGCGTDILQILDGDVVPYDKVFQSQDHEAQTMYEIKDNTYDFVYSSNCLEHISSPTEALHSWIRIVKRGGIVFFTVPDETLYEHDKWPSTFNKAHLWSFTTKNDSKLPKSIHIQSWLKRFGVEVLSIEIIDTGYDHSLGNVDQTQMGAEAFIEVIIRKYI